MRILKIFILLFIILLINSCSKAYKPEQPEGRIPPSNVPIVSAQDVSVLTPEEVVALYFQAWNNKQYNIMYSLISDGFKQIEPTAKTFEDFKVYMASFFETSSSIDIIQAKASYQNEVESGVGYKIEITKKDSTRKIFSSFYTLKKRQNGWKLIHPYGENIDTS